MDVSTNMHALGEKQGTDYQPPPQKVICGKHRQSVKLL